MYAYQEDSVQVNMLALCLVHETAGLRKYCSSESAMKLGTKEGTHGYQTTVFSRF